MRTRPCSRLLALGSLWFATVASTTTAQSKSDTTTRADVSRPSVSVLPVVGSAPETGFQYGVTAVRMYRLGPTTSTRVSQDQVYAIRTSKSQTKAFVQTDRWLRGDDWRVRVRAEYARFPLPFYGVGQETPDAAEEWYTSTGPVVLALVQRRVAHATFAGLAARVTHTAVSDVEPGRGLATGHILGLTGGTVSQVQGFMARDSRDHVVAAHVGSFLQLTSTLANGAWGSDFDFARYAIDGRKYWTLGGAHVLAAQFLLEATSGSAPFDQMVQIGSDTAMRGYTRGRYRDNDGIGAQVEYRSPFVKRLGVVGFAGVGGVAPTVGKLAEATVRPSYGAGLRILLFPAERATIRIDYARGTGSSGLYVALGEAF